VFGDIDPRTITPEDLQALRSVVARTVSESEAFRTIKVQRAPWKKMAAIGCCARDNDPLLAYANSAPRPRHEIWSHHDVSRNALALRTRSDCAGSAGHNATADRRSLNHRGSARERRSWSRVLSRSRKTGRTAAGTLWRWSEAIVDAYLKKLRIELHDKTPLFWSRGDELSAGARALTPRPHKKDRLSRDFADPDTSVRPN
jgi:hypothetical protein